MRLSILVMVHELLTINLWGVCKDKMNWEDMNVQKGGQRSVQLGTKKFEKVLIVSELYNIKEAMIK